MKPGPKELELRALKASRLSGRQRGAKGAPGTHLTVTSVSGLASVKKFTVETPAATAPVQPAPKAQPKETTMKTKKTKAKVKAKKRSVSEAAANLRAAKKSKANARKKVEGASDGVRPGSKLEIVANLLKRPEGCTTAEVLAATGWPTISMPQQAKAAGLTLSKEKDGKVTRYRGAAV